VPLLRSQNLATPIIFPRVSGELSGFLVPAIRGSSQSFSLPSGKGEAIIYKYRPKAIKINLK